MVDKTGHDAELLNSSILQNRWVTWPAAPLGHVLMTNKNRSV